MFDPTKVNQTSNLNVCIFMVVLKVSGYQQNASDEATTGLLSGTDLGSKNSFQFLELCFVRGRFRTVSDSWNGLWFQESVRLGNGFSVKNRWV